jgi:hypothetical protein
MRSVHRPIHEDFIFSSDWARMTDEQREKATKEGKFPLPSPREFKSMKKEELIEWKTKFKPYFEELKQNVLDVFKSYPKCLLFVSRYDENHSLIFPYSSFSFMPKPIYCF